MIKIIRNVLFILIFFSRTSLADEIRYLMRSPKALLMGDAYTSIADDDYALFYNPASLAFNKGLGMTLANVSSAFPNLLDANILKKFTGPVGTDFGDITDKFMGVPIGSQAGVSPTFKMQKLAISFFLNHRINFNMTNKAHPVWNIDLIYDRGIILGGSFGFKMFGGDNAFGMSIKSMNRRGFSGKFDLFGPTLGLKLSSGNMDLDSIRRSLGDATSKTAYGFDLGWMFRKGYSSSELALGFSILDVFGTRFVRSEGLRDLPDQDMIVNMGASWKYESTLFDYTVALDIHPVDMSIDFGRKVHLGLNIGLPFLDILFGWNAGYVSYGASFDAIIGKFTAGYHGIETGANYRQQEAKRIVVYWSFIDLNLGN